MSQSALPSMVNVHLQRERPIPLDQQPRQVSSLVDVAVGIAVVDTILVVRTVVAPIGQNGDDEVVLDAEDCDR